MENKINKRTIIKIAKGWIKKEKNQNIFFKIRIDNKILTGDKK